MDDDTSDQDEMTLTDAIEWGLLRTATCQMTQSIRF